MLPSPPGGERPRLRADGLGLDENAPGGNGEARLHRVVDPARAGRPLRASGASSSRPAATWSSRIGSATAGSSEPYIVPVRNFSRRRNSPGSRSSRTPVRREADHHRRSAAAREAERRRARLGEADGVEAVVGAVGSDCRHRLLEVVRMDGVCRAEPKHLRVGRASTGSTTTIASAPAIRAPWTTN